MPRSVGSSTAGSKTPTAHNELLKARAVMGMDVTDAFMFLLRIRTSLRISLASRLGKPGKLGAVLFEENPVGRAVRGEAKPGIRRRKRLAAQSDIVRAPLFSTQAIGLSRGTQSDAKT